MIDLTPLRKEYASKGLDRALLPLTPFPLFEQWLQDIINTGVFEPNAMIVATADALGKPSQRTVLLKSYDDQGFVFFTNYGSRKAQQLAGNDQVSLLFPWIGLHRQVIVEGRAQKVSRDESLAYFTSRPRGSQLGAWASRQSAVIQSRSELEQQHHAIEQAREGREVELPDFWGGYRIQPTRVEFWQGRDHRLHDRFVYQSDDTEAWSIDRLSP